MRALTLLFVAVCTGLAHAQDDPSLEELLRHARERRAAEEARLAPLVEEAASNLENAWDESSLSRSSTATAAATLLAYGSPVAPLLVKGLDPGPVEDLGVRHRARVFAQVLRELSSPAVTDSLLSLASRASVDGRINALLALETSAETERVIPRIKKLFENSNGRTRAAALKTLGHLGSPEAFETFVGALSDSDSSIVGVALQALASVPADKAVPLVLDFLGTSTAHRQLPGLLEFYKSHPEPLIEDDDHLEALVEVVTRRTASSRQVEAMLTYMTEIGVDPRSSARRKLEGLTDVVNDGVREASLILLARARDKGARKRFLTPYDRAIERQPDYHGVFTERGDAYYRLADYTEAIKDYKMAVRLRRGRTPVPEPFIGTARAYARMGRYKDAAEELKTAPLSITEVRSLAKDPAFAEMLETRYRSAFRLVE